MSIESLAVWAGEDLDRLLTDLDIELTDAGLLDPHQHIAALETAGQGFLAEVYRAWREAE